MPLRGDCNDLCDIEAAGDLRDRGGVAGSRSCRGIEDHRDVVPRPRLAHQLRLTRRRMEAGPAGEDDRSRPRRDLLGVGEASRADGVKSRVASTRIAEDGDDVTLSRRQCLRL
jgi:hypothetical protein